MGPTVSAGNFYCKLHLSKHTFFARRPPSPAAAAIPFLISYRLVSIEFFLLFAALKFSCTQKLSLWARLSCRGFLARLFSFSGVRLTSPRLISGCQRQPGTAGWSQMHGL
jgi:hypothetical protein